MRITVTSQNQSTGERSVEKSQNKTKKRIGN